MSMEKVKVGVVGCGNISDAYFKASPTFKWLDIAICSDLNMEAAKEKAELYSIEAITPDELYARENVSIILNLTTPQAHVPVNLAAIKAGKHTYCEKPYALNRASAKQVLDAADAAGLNTGCAPDTFLGGSHQTCRKLIDDNWIGDILSGTAFMMCAGHESWHPAPEFYYLPGGGPLLDMGPYYITALVNLLGPVKRVCAMTGQGFDQRICTSEKRFGDVIPVETATHIAGILEFVNGALITLVMSFDVKRHSNACIELHGTNGSMSVPDPNGFGGEIKICRERGSDWQAVPTAHGYTDNMRSIGLADMALAIQQGRDARCDGKRAYHVLDVMLSLLDSGKKGEFVTIESTCTKPAALPLNLLHGELD
jgi:predicted dehydrogenase